MTRRTGWRRSVALAAAVVCGSVVAGCQSEGAASPSPSPSVSSSSASPTASPSPSPSPTEGEIPAAARVQSEEGAEAFVRFFFDRLNAAWTKPQTGVISSLSDPECQFCKKTEDTAKFLVDEGQRYATPPTELSGTQPFGGAPQDEQFLEIELTQLKADIVDGDGRVVATDPRKTNKYYVTLRWTDRSWFVLELERTG